MFYIYGKLGTTVRKFYFLGVAIVHVFKTLNSITEKIKQGVHQSAYETFVFGTVGRRHQLTLTKMFHMR